MATKIKNTNAYATIKSITVSKEKAFVTFLIYSNKEELIHTPYNFYIEDLNDKNEVVSSNLLNNNTYWLNYYNFGLTTTDNNSDLKLYNEITFEVDITKFNSMPIKDLRWMRRCRFILFRMPLSSELPTFKGETVWDSGTINLISEEILLPEIKYLRAYSLNTDDDSNLEKIVAEANYVYETQYDFNYYNSNIEYIFSLINPKTKRVFETVALKENDLLDENKKLNLIKYTFAGEFNNFVEINLKIRVVNGEVILNKSILYKPQRARNPIFVKTKSGEIEKVTSTFEKE
jgi:hypothetical protein